MAALGLIVAVVLLIVIIGGDDEDPARATPEGASASKLERLAERTPFPIYWAGRRAGLSFELSRTKDGSVYIRYLPQGIALGDSAANYLTVGTYPVRDALGELEKQARSAGASVERAPKGAFTYVDPRSPQSAYFAYPRADFEVEVFDPKTGRAKELLTDGEIVPIP